MTCWVEEDGNRVKHLEEAKEVCSPSGEQAGWVPEAVVAKAVM
jgi:hypothetical protein